MFVWCFGSTIKGGNLRQENLISKSEFKKVLELIHNSGMTKSKFAVTAGVNPGYLLRVIKSGQMSRKLYDRLMEVV